MGRLIIDGNSVYEIDDECIRKKEKERERERIRKESNRNQNSEKKQR